MAKKRIAAFLAPNLGLSVAGDYAYAYGGGIGAAAVSQTWLDFMTGEYLTVGTFQLNTPVKADTPLDMSGVVAVLKLNGSVICNLVANPQSSPEATGATFVTQDLIIPPFTRLTVVCQTDAEDLDDIGSCIFTARIYNV